MESKTGQAIAAQRDAAIAWLAGPEARTVARRRLSPLGGMAAVVAGDVVQDAVSAVLVRFGGPSARMLDGGPDAAVRYANRIVQNKAADVLRGRRRAAKRGEVPWSDRLVDDAGAGRDADADGPSTGSAARAAVADGGDLIDVARMAVLVAPVADDLRSAALTYLAVDTVPTVPARFGLPLPRAGADSTQRRMWPALWLAGRQSLFEGVDSAAQRKARSRAAGKVMDLLGEVLAELQVHGVVSGAAGGGTH